MMLGRRSTLRRACGWWRCAAGAALALAALCALRAPLPPRRTHRAAAVPHAPPHKLAAHLADFNNLRHLYPDIESWRIEEQWSNYTSWRYAVRFMCGSRCGGRGAVAAHDRYEGAAPAHGHAAAHAVRVQLAACRTLPLLPWPAFCDELEVEWEVSGDGAGGARLREAAAARAPALLRYLRRKDPLPDTSLQALTDAFP